MAARLPGMEDVPARIIGGLGLVVAVASLGLTWYLWWRAGPRLQVSAFVRAETAAIHVEAASIGRIAVTLRQLEIRDHFTVTAPGGQPSIPTSRWALPISPGRWVIPTEPDTAMTVGRASSVELPPTASVYVDVPVGEVLSLAGSSPAVTVAAWVQRGDGKWFSSKPLQIR